MASCSTRKSSMIFCLFNCDGLCSLDQVKTLLRAVEGKIDFKINVEEQPFGNNEISTMVEKTIPGLRMNYAVFTLHASESHWLNEDGHYGKIYKALKQATSATGSGEKVLIVIGGDEEYENKDEEEKEYISHKAYRTIQTQFRKEFMDGRKSFVFSWNKQHRPIHEEALLHYFDPSKKGKIFKHQPRVSKKYVPVNAKVPEKPADSSEERKPKDNDNIACNPQPTVDEIRRPSPPAFTEGARAIFPSGTVLLSTKMRYGVISYKTEDVTIWEDDKKWRVSAEEERRLKNDWKTTPTAQLELLTDSNGVVKIKVKDVSTFTERYCSIS